MSRLGGLGSGSGSSLVAKLVPLLAPVVMAWLAKRVTGQGGSVVPQAPASSTAGSGSLTDILQSVLGGAVSGAASSSRSAPGGLNAGSIVTDILGGLLGGGRR